MASFDLPEMPEARISPQWMLGVASPLWGYYGAFAAGGVAYWWLSQLVRPMNVEAFFAAAGKAAPALPSMAEVERVVEALVEPVAEAQVAVLTAVAEAPAAVLAPAPEPTVGGEAAPVSPVLTLVPDVEPTEPEKPALLAASDKPEPEPASFIEAAPVIEPLPPEPPAAPKAKGRKSTAPPAFDA